MCDFDRNCLCPPAGVLQSRNLVQAGGAARHSDQEEHLFVPGCLPGISGQTGLQEEEGKTAARRGSDTSLRISLCYITIFPDGAF